MDRVLSADQFEWDGYNINKNWKKHRVQFTECEEAFFDPGLKVLPDEAHSVTEQRFLALGQSAKGRSLFVVFTERNGKIRVISARDMSRRERRAYREKIKKDSQVQE